MAVALHASLGPAANDPELYDLPAGATIERTGVTAGDAGWVKYGGAAALVNPPMYQTDVPEVNVPSTGFVWDIFYAYQRPLSGSGAYKGMLRYEFSYTSSGGIAGWCRAEVYLRFINDAGTYKYELVEYDYAPAPFTDQVTATTTSLGKSASMPPEVNRTVTLRVDIAAKKVYLYLGRALAITGTLVLTDYVSGFQSLINHFLYVPASSEANDAYWSSWGRLSSATAADFDETAQYPEVRGHYPNGNGAHTAMTGVYTDWDDLAANGLNDETVTLVTQGQAAAKESSTVSSKTYTNTVIGATIDTISRANVTAKTIPWSMLMRYSGTDKELAMPSPADTNYRCFNASYNAMPSGAAWSNINSVEIGADRTAAGDAVFLDITAIWLEGFAIGTTKKVFADPPAVPTGQPIMKRHGGSIQPTGAQRFGRGWHHEGETIQGWPPIPCPAPDQGHNRIRSHRARGRRRGGPDIATCERRRNRRAIAQT